MSFEVKMRKYVALLVAFLMLFLSTAGCIDIYLVKDLLVPHEKNGITYGIVKYNFNHSFNSPTPTPDNPDPIERYEKEFRFPVKPDTKHMRFDIAVEMRSAQELWETINETIGDPELIPEWLKDLLEQLVEAALEYTNQRYVDITIFTPEGDEIFNNIFNDTETVQFPPENPLAGPNEGEWVIAVEGAGIGKDLYEDLTYHDSFSIDVTINEPTGP